MKFKLTGELRRFEWNGNYFDKGVNVSMQLQDFRLPPLEGPITGTGLTKSGSFYQIIGQLESNNILNFATTDGIHKMYFKGELSEDRLKINGVYFLTETQD